MTRGNYKVQDVETSKHAERDTSYRTCILSLFIFLILCIIIFVIAWTTWKPLSGMTEVYLHQDRSEGGHYATTSRINDIVTESYPWKTTKRLHVEAGTTRHSVPTTARTNFSKLLPSSTKNRTEQSKVKIKTKFYTQSTTSSNISKTHPFTLSQTTTPSTFGNDSTTEGHLEITSRVSPNDTIVFVADNSSVVVTPSLNITSPSIKTNWNISVHNTDQFNATKILLPNSTTTKMLVSETTIISTSQVAGKISTTPGTATTEDTDFYDTDVTDRHHDDSPPEKSFNVLPVDDTSTTSDASYTHFINRTQHDIIAINEEPSTESTRVNILTLNVTDQPFLNTTQHKINVETNIPASSPKDVTSSVFVLSEQQTYITNITRKIADVIATEYITKFREATTINEEGEEETITPSSQAMDVSNTTANETITRSSEPIGVINTTEGIIILSTESIDNTNNTEEETITLSPEPIDVINTTEGIMLSTESIDRTNNIEEETITLSSELIDVTNTTEEIIILSTEAIDRTNNIEEETITLSSELIDVTVTTEEELSSESIKVTVVSPIGARNSTISKSAETHNSDTASENQITTTPAIFSVNTSISSNSTI